MGRYHDYIRRTLRTRIPAILEVAGERQDADAQVRLGAIAREIADDAPMLLDMRDWELPGWDALPARVNGRRPSEASFFDFEHWLYYRLLVAVGYPEHRLDPFQEVKHRDLERHINWAAQAVLTTRTLPEALTLSLHANAHDLSQVSDPASSYHLGSAALASEAETLRRLNIIADNFGGEFVADLILAIVAAEGGAEVVVHVKQLPMFVSDTTMEDVTILLDRLPRDLPYAKRLRAQHDGGAIRFAAHPFWSSPKFMDELPVSELTSGEGVLNVLKGDLNFRRAIGDVTVPGDTTFGDLPTLPAVPMLSLRSIKSYCVAGMSEWPDGLSREDFPTDGSIVLAQHIPGRATASA